MDNLVEKFNNFSRLKTILSNKIENYIQYQENYIDIIN